MAGSTSPIHPMRAAREQAMLSQAEMAKRVEKKGAAPCDARKVFRWESGVRPYPVSQRAICEVLGVTPAEMGWLDRPEPNAIVPSSQPQDDDAEPQNTMAVATGPTDPPKTKAADMVLVPYVTAAGAVEHVRISRRAFVATGGLAAVMLAGAATIDEFHRLMRALEEPQRADWQVVEQFRRMLAVQKSNEYTVEPALRLAPVAQQVSVLDRLSRDAKPALGSALLSMQAEYAEYAGWLHQETGNQQSAATWTDKAIVYAHESGDFQMVSFATTRKVNIASWGGRCRKAANLAERARQVPWSIPPGLAALGSIYEAHALARLGHESDAMRLIDDAAELITRRNDAGEDRVWWAQRHSHEDLLGVHAYNLVELGRLADAVEILGTLLPSNGLSSPSDAGPMATLALAHARAGDARASVAAGEEALELTDSACTLSVLQTARRELERWKHEDFVQRFGIQLDARRSRRRAANGE